ncbi:MAG: aminotransferase class I/II-fold pyridoxal phosphate-dependent enzyme [Pseudomonadota bacterium]
MRFASLVDRVAGEGAEAWKIHDAARRALDDGEDILMLSVGDPDFPTPEPISAAAIAALKSGDTHYTGVSGRRGLRRRIAEFMAQEVGQPYTEDNVIVLAGAQCALFSSIQCLAEAGDEVIILDPAYVTYEALVRATGATLVRVAQPPDTGFRPDVSAIKAAITPRTRAIIMTNPNNPTGVVMTRPELEGIASLAREHNLWVVSDEVYGDLVFEGQHLPIAALPGMAERTVTVSSLSKSHAMTGWRVGWAVGPSELIAHLGNLALAMLYGLPGFIQAGAEMAFEDDVKVVDPMRETYRQRRNVAMDALSGIPGLRFEKPQAGMFLMVDIRALGIEPSEFAWGLFNAKGVSVLDAAPFGACAKGHIRLSFTLDETQTTEACRRIADYVRNLA